MFSLSVTLDFANLPTFQKTERVLDDTITQGAFIGKYHFYYTDEIVSVFWKEDKIF